MNSNYLGFATAFLACLILVFFCIIVVQIEDARDKIIAAIKAAHEAREGRWAERKRGDQMINRPPVQQICYMSAEGNPHVFVVGQNCSEIREVEEYGEYAFIPFVEAWQGDKLLFRSSQHKLEHILY